MRVARAVAFWLVPLLAILSVAVVATGLDSPRSLGAFLGLLCLTVLAMRIGHDHRRSTG